MEVEMTIRGLMMDPVSNMPIVILKDVGGETVLPIWVGVYEANAIALEMEKVSTPRPMTHDLIKNVLTGLETLVHKVVVTELKEDTFYAVIWLERSGEVIRMQGYGLANVERFTAIGLDVARAFVPAGCDAQIIFES